MPQEEMQESTYQPQMSQEQIKEETQQPQLPQYQIPLEQNNVKKKLVIH